MSNYKGGMTAARLQFMIDLQYDKDYIEHKNKALKYGAIHVVDNDQYSDGKKISQIVKKYLNKKS